MARALPLYTGVNAPGKSRPSGTVPIVAETHDEGGDKRREFFPVTTKIAAVAIVDPRRTTVLLSARAGVGLFTGRTKMMRHLSFSDIPARPGGVLGSVSDRFPIAQPMTLVTVEKWSAHGLAAGTALDTSVGLNGLSPATVIDVLEDSAGPCKYSGRPLPASVWTSSLGGDYVWSQLTPV